MAVNGVFNRLAGGRAGGAAASGVAPAMAEVHVAPMSSTCWRVMAPAGAQTRAG